MDDRQLNPLHTGVLFVVPGQIMDPGIMKLPRHRDHLSRLRADVGIDDVELAPAPVARRTWSIRPLLERVADPAGDIAGRYARTHAAFTTDEFAARYGLSHPAADELLHHIAAAGRIIEGEFRRTR